MKQGNGITAKQLQTLAAVANGMSVTEVGTKFEISASTVSSNLGRAIDNVIADAAAKRLPTVPGSSTADVCAKLAVSLGYLEIKRWADEVNMYVVHPRYGIITNRQRELLILVARGLSSTEVQDALHITRNTYVTHMRRTRKHLGARNNTNAVATAFSLRILNGGDLA